MSKCHGSTTLLLGDVLYGIACRNLESQLTQIQALGSGLKTGKEFVHSAVDRLTANIQLAVHTIKSSPDIQVDC
jgi:hypothetical protein